MRNAVLGLSGGVDSAVVAFLAVRALGAEHVHAIRMPYRTSSPDSLADAQTVIDAVGKAKPNSFKGHYIKTVALSSSQNPAVRIASTEYGKY